MYAFITLDHGLDQAGIERVGFFILRVMLMQFLDHLILIITPPQKNKNKIK